jgi:hypothetical protein
VPVLPVLPVLQAQAQAPLREPEPQASYRSPHLMSYTPEQTPLLAPTPL